MNDIICFQTDGHIEDFALESFGISAKRTDNPIGKFGTGLKYAIAITLNKGGKVTLWRGLEPTRFGIKHLNVRGNEVAMAVLGDKVLPFATHLGSSWEPWMPFREMYANTIDEHGLVGPLNDLFPTEGKTTFEFECPNMTDAYNNRHEIFIAEGKEIVFETDDFTAYKGKSMFFYYRGVRAYSLQKPTAYTYSFKNIELTEDRTIKSEWNARYQLSSYFGREATAVQINHMLDHAQNGYEIDLDFTYRSLEGFRNVVETRLEKRRYVTPNAQKAFDLASSPLERLERIPDVILQAEEEADLLTALDIVAKIGFKINRNNVIIKEKLLSGESIASVDHLCFIHHKILRNNQLTRGLLNVAMAIEENEAITQSGILDTALDIIINNHKNTWAL